MEEAFSLGSVVRGHPEMRAYLVANALWEASLGALKTFVFLFITVGLGHSQAASAGIVGGVALLILPAAVISGKLADRYGRLRAMVWVLPLYGFGQLVPAFTDSIAILVPIMLIVGFGGGLVMTLPYALLQPLMPHGRHGTLTGFYSLSRGIGTAIGPLLAGVAIEVLDGPFGSTDGYAAMWLVCGGSILLSIPFLMRLRHLAGHIIDPDTEPPPRGGGRRLARHAQDELRGLQRDVELRAVTDAVQLDPVGVREPVAAEPRRGRRPRAAAGRPSPTPRGPGSRCGRRRASSRSRPRGRAGRRPAGRRPRRA